MATNSQAAEVPSEPPTTSRIGWIGVGAIALFALYVLWWLARSDADLSGFPQLVVALALLSGIVNAERRASRAEAKADRLTSQLGELGAQFRALEARVTGLESGPGTTDDDAD